MNVSFANFVKKHPPAAGNALHLVHCTSGRRSFKVLADRQIGVTPCPVYKADLAYLFYGRPAYKPGGGLAANNIVDLAPVCLVVDPSILKTAVRILPFDSGGFKKYEPLLGPDLSLNDFELDLDATAPLRLVRAFYDTNRNYYEQEPTLAASKIAVSKVTSTAYARLIADSSIRKMDDRSATVEVQFDSALQLKKVLRALVAPNAFFEDSEIKAALAECPDTVWLPYKTYGRTEPDILTYALLERVDAFLTDSGSFP